MNKIFFRRYRNLFLSDASSRPRIGASSRETNPAGVSSSSVESALELAAKGHCQQALPLSEIDLRIHDKDLKYRAAMATARCAMSLDQEETAVQALWMLGREFPSDPQALYIRYALLF